MNTATHRTRRSRLPTLSALLAGAITLVTLALVTLALGSTVALAAPMLTASPPLVNLTKRRDTGASTLTWTGVTPSVPLATQTDRVIDGSMVKAQLPCGPQ